MTNNKPEFVNLEENKKKSSKINSNAPINKSKEFNLIQLSHFLEWMIGVLLLMVVLGIEKGDTFNYYVVKTIALICLLCLMFYWFNSSSEYRIKKYFFEKVMKKQIEQFEKEMTEHLNKFKKNMSKKKEIKK